MQSATRDQKVGKIAIAYTVWSKKKGGGKLIVKEVYKKIKKSNHLNRLVTLSPLTEMAKKFHLRNKAKLLQVNKTTQNFYSWLSNINNNKHKIPTRIIGFSATPEKIDPLTNILSKYSIWFRSISNTDSNIIRTSFYK